MNSIATIKIKIPHNYIFLETMKQYSYSANKVIDCGWNIKSCNKIKLHNLTYYKIREETRLPAQLVCSSRDRAAEILKASKFKNSKPVMNEFLAVRYDARSFSFNINQSCVSLVTINGRIKIPVNIPEYYLKYIDWKVRSADLVLDKKNMLFLHVAMSKEIEARGINAKNINTSSAVLGIDLGVNNIAVTSDRKFFSSNKIKSKKLKFRHLRRKLQSKGTRSSRRLLKKLSGREKRFMAWINHNISKEIVSNFDGNRIIMEELKGIRKIRRGKRMNYWLGNWSFYQLQRFIQYKAERKGIEIIRVNPRYTSQICSKCGNLGSRSKGFFSCSHCDYSLNADLNASFNLAKHYSMADNVLVDVNQPHIPDVDVEAGIRN